MKALLFTTHTLSRVVDLGDIKITLVPELIVLNRVTLVCKGKNENYMKRWLEGMIPLLRDDR